MSCHAFYVVITNNQYHLKEEIIFQMGIDCEKNVYICDVGGEQNHEQARVKKICLLCRVKWFHVINPSTQESILY